MKLSKYIFGGILLVILIIGIVSFLKINGREDAKKSNDTSHDYTIVFVGDSMTNYLGNFDELHGYLKKYYPQKKFLLLNYGFSSTNILSVPDRIAKETRYMDRMYQPINDISFDLIFIESMGHNPLSDFSLEEGLKKQTETLDKVIELLTQKHPKSSIIFMSTIAPNRNRYAEGVVNLMPEKRQAWAAERIAYIKNHMMYAKSHNIPLLDIYHMTIDENDSGKIDYINTNDWLHPSPTAIFFISEEIAKFINKNKLLPSNAFWFF